MRVWQPYQRILTETHTSKTDYTADMKRHGTPKTGKYEDACGALHLQQAALRNVLAVSAEKITNVYRIC